MKNTSELVNVYVDDIDDLFNKFDNEDISDDFAQYIENRCSRTKKNELTIKLITKFDLDKHQKDRIVTAIRSHYGIENKFLGLEVKKINRVNICYLIAGLLTILVGTSIHIGSYIPEVIDVLGGFIVYESAFNLLFTDNELDLKSYRAIKISKAHVVFELLKSKEES